MKRFLVFLVAAFAAQSAAAEELTYHCKVKGRDGWIAPEYYFRLDPETGKAQVINGYHDWTDADLITRKNSTYQMTWRVTLQSSQGQAIRMRYQANLNQDNNKVKVRGTFGNVSASNKPYGTGNCAIVEHDPVWREQG
ncbi:hypothetical protein [Ruegeria arenilitoris]|uniref:hypothetical protein n=1 Tax=Ruegeria arenilitoris TaxID=1173585 RepID=UPI00147DE1F2|nr:hypothetical protein [Ruegeria arenilitoris]